MWGIEVMHVASKSSTGGNLSHHPCLFAIRKCAMTKTQPMCVSELSNRHVLKHAENLRLMFKRPKRSEMMNLTRVHAAHDAGTAVDRQHRLTAHLTPKVSSLCLSTWISPPAGTSIAVTYASPGKVSSESVPRLLRLCCSASTTSAAPIGPAAAEHREVSLSWLPLRMAILGMSRAAMRSPTP